MKKKIRVLAVFEYEVTFGAILPETMEQVKSRIDAVARCSARKFRKKFEDGMIAQPGMCADPNGTVVEVEFKDA